jgi:hypothetical protein
MDRPGPGWPTVLALMLVAASFSVFNPVPLVVIPLGLFLLALAPKAPRMLLVAAALVAVAVMGPRETMWYVERGWALLLAGWFVVVVVAWPRASFTGRAVAATAAAMASAAAIIAARGAWAVLDHTIAEHYRDVADMVGRVWPGAAIDAETMVAWAGEFPARLFPGLTAVGSVAALAVAWWAFGRLSGLGRPLGSLKEFRFPDALVWLLIAGLALLLIPIAGWAPRLGSNLLVFIGALYALRGLAVMVGLVLAMVGSNVAVLVVLTVVAVLLYPIVVAGTLLLGVTDTWLDLRSGRRAVNEEG